MQLLVKWLLVLIHGPENGKARRGKLEGRRWKFGAAGRWLLFAGGCMGFMVCRRFVPDGLMGIKVNNG